MEEVVKGAEEVIRSETRKEVCICRQPTGCVVTETDYSLGNESFVLKFSGLVGA
jgi:hypothetical protein